MKSFGKFQEFTLTIFAQKIGRGRFRIFDFILGVSSTISHMAEIF